MRIAVSPYHLTTREPAAAAALLLGGSIVTMLPGREGGPAGGTLDGPAEAAGAAARVPRYLDFMQSWRWTVPLWHAGVIGAAWCGEDASGDVRGVCEAIAADEGLACLRGFLRPELLESGERYLEAVSRDVLKGGPDPGVSVPVAAGMDRFAGRHGMMVFRSEPTSVAQRAEERLGERVFSVAVPVLLQASAERYLLARELLGEELEDLRAELAGAAEGALAGRRNGSVAGLASAARAYAAAFEAERGELLSGPKSDDEEDVRAVEGMVVLTGVVLPGDAALTSSVAALRAVTPGLAAAPANAGNLPARAGPFFTVLVRVVGRKVAHRK
jgi:hypothetical protein